jgi:hypothetical protein
MPARQAITTNRVWAKSPTLDDLTSGVHSTLNVGRNVIAHELGHAIGLRDNDDPTTLMCGWPALCRPALFQSDVSILFLLTEADKALLLQLYPATWTPAR